MRIIYKLNYKNIFLIVAFYCKNEKKQLLAFASIPDFWVTIESIPTLQKSLQTYPLYDQLQTYRKKKKKKEEKQEKQEEEEEKTKEGEKEEEEKKKQMKKEKEEEKMKEEKEASSYLKEMTNDNGNQTVPMVTANASTSRTTPALAPAEKLENILGINFKRWKQKMFFNLTTLNLQKFIKEDVPILPDETPENERFLVAESWKHSDFLCKNYILSGLEDDLYNVYSNVETSKQLWIELERKYKTEDAGLKKFVAAKCLDYTMVDSKSVITQVQELQVLSSMKHSKLQR
ncbi:uncharacterized protein [Nicotiana tomentosiformis]|uniref:uncharacterized protein n=1 Tax=Nicotiana tomentosiformis TaxID=4098 RepID=UPI00388C5B2C